MSPLLTSGTEQSDRSTIGSPAFILNLPEELLCLVIAAVARREHPYGIHYPSLIFGHPGRNEALGFSRLSEVCRRFRALLLSMPALWAAVVFDLPQNPGKLALARSQSLPLSALINNTSMWDSREEVGVPGLHCERLVTLAVEHVARLSFLKASGLKEDECRRLFCRPLPMLRHLEFSHAISEPPVTGESICVGAPNAQRASLVGLALKCVLVARDQVGGISFDLPNLRHLEIDVHDEEWTGTVDLNWLVDVLQNSPHIQDLSVTFYCHDNVFRWDEIVDGRSLQLTELRSLELMGSTAANMPDFFDYIFMARQWLARCVVTLELCRRRGHRELNRKLDFLNAFCPMLHHPSHDGLLVRFKSEFHTYTLEVVVLPSIHNLAQYSPLFWKGMPEVRQLSLEFSAEISNTIYQQAVGVLAAALKCDTIKQLIIDAPGAEEWPFSLEPIFEICSTVDELLIQYPWQSSQPELPILTSPWILPTLRTIFIRPIVDSTRRHKKYSCGEVLVAWLEGRNARGIPIHRLHILESIHSQNRKDNDSKAMDDDICARAAAFVEELLDERDTRIRQ